MTPHATIRTAALLIALVWTSAPVAATSDPPPPRTRLSDGGGALVLTQAPPSADRRRALETWARRYRRLADPARRAAARCFDTLDGDTAVEMREECEALARRVAELVGAEMAEAPHFAVRRHARTAVARLGDAATACLTRRPTAAHNHWRAARRAFAEVDRLLARLIGD